MAAASAKQAADRAQADLEQRLATHQQQHDAERQGLEGQIQELEQGIREREDLIAELHLAEAQARSSVVMYQVRERRRQGGCCRWEGCCGVGAEAGQKPAYPEEQETVYLEEQVQGLKKEYPST